MYIFKFEYGSQSPPNFCDFVFANYAIMRVKNMNPLHYVTHQDMCEKSTREEIKTLPQAKRHKSSLLFTYLTILKFITR